MIVEYKPMSASYELSQDGYRKAEFRSVPEMKRAAEALLAFVKKKEDEEREFAEKVATMKKWGHEHRLAKVVAVRAMTKCGLKEAIAIVDALTEGGRV